MRRPPRATRTDTLFPDATLFRAAEAQEVSRYVGGQNSQVGLHVAGGHVGRRAGKFAGSRIEACLVSRARFWKVCHVGYSCDASACGRSEEHTSELQSLMRISYAVFCLKNK